MDFAASGAADISPSPWLPKQRPTHYMYKEWQHKYEQYRKLSQAYIAPRRIDPNSVQFPFVRVDELARKSKHHDIDDLPPLASDCWFELRDLGLEIAAEAASKDSCDLHDLAAQIDRRASRGHAASTGIEDNVDIDPSLRLTLLNETSDPSFPSTCIRFDPSHHLPGNEPWDESFSRACGWQPFSMHMLETSSTTQKTCKKQTERFPEKLGPPSMTWLAALEAADRELKNMSMDGHSIGFKSRSDAIASTIRERSIWAHHLFNVLDACNCGTLQRSEFISFQEQLAQLSSNCVLRCCEETIFGDRVHCGEFVENIMELLEILRAEIPELTLVCVHRVAARTSTQRRLAIARGFAKARQLASRRRVASHTRQGNSYVDVHRRFVKSGYLTDEALASSLDLQLPRRLQSTTTQQVIELPVSLRCAGLEQLAQLMTHVADPIYLSPCSRSYDVSLQPDASFEYLSKIYGKALCNTTSETPTALELWTDMGSLPDVAVAEESDDDSDDEAGALMNLLKEPLGRCCLESELLSILQEARSKPTWDTMLSALDQCAIGLARIRTQRRLISITCVGGVVVGTGMNGDEMFKVSDVPLRCQAAFLRANLAEALGVREACVELFQGHCKLFGEDMIDDVSVVTLNVGSYLSNVMKWLAEEMKPSDGEILQAFVSTCMRSCVYVPKDALMLAEAYIETFPLETLNLTADQLCTDVFPNDYDLYFDQNSDRREMAHRRASFWDTALFPTFRNLILDHLRQSDDDGIPLMRDVFENCNMALVVRLLDAGASASEFLSETEIEHLRRTVLLLKDFPATQQRHVDLCSAIVEGDAHLVTELLETRADPNLDGLDGDSATVSPLVIAMNRKLTQSWAHNLFGTYDKPSKSTMDVVNALLACPRTDPNVGAYKYGWHGSFHRCSPVGFAMIDEFTCDMAVGSGNRDLIASPIELLRRLLQDPRVDLECVAIERGENSSEVRYSALDLVARSSCGINYRLVQELLGAGAMLNSKWQRRLSRIPRVLHARSRGECKRAGRKERALFRMREFLDWFLVVRQGGRVLDEPFRYPVAFRNLAALLSKVMVPLLSRELLRRILDCLQFWDVKMSKTSMPSHARMNHMGRPLGNMEFAMMQVDLTRQTRGNIRLTQLHDRDDGNLFEAIQNWSHNAISSDVTYLPLQLSDKIFAESSYKKDWLFGMNLTSDTTGWFPAVCVKCTNQEDERSTQQASNEPSDCSSESEGLGPPSDCSSES